MAEQSDSPLGLRERKKARTRAAIQEHALKLFGRQGYDATTMEQIADAAEISESTLYRYFPTKEDLVLLDDFDPILIEEFHAQPPELSPIRALRASFRAAAARLSVGQRATQQQRTQLIAAVPELRAAMLAQFAQTIQQVAELVAQRVGRQPDDFEVRNLAGAVIGVSMSAMFATAQDPDTDWMELIDSAFAHLEAGLHV